MLDIPHFLITLYILLVLGLGTCKGPSAIAPPTTSISPALATSTLTVASPKSSPSSPSTSPVSKVTPVVDITIGPEQIGHLVVATVGQKIAVARPADFAEWQIDYDSSVLSLIAPETVHTPGPEGWLFEAIAPGQTAIALTTTIPPCKSNLPCPPIPAQFSFTIEVRK